jgi:hypothetical protein
MTIGKSAQRRTDARRLVAGQAVGDQAQEVPGQVGRRGESDEEAQRIGLELGHRPRDIGRA